MTINKGILLGFVPSGDTQVQLRSAQFEGEVCFRVDEIQHPIGLAIKNGASTLSPSKEKSIWGTYKARGAVYALQTSKKNLKQGIVGYLSGSNGLDSSGLSSSAAVSNRYRHTALQSSFSCNMVGICDGEPKLMGLKELLQAFIDFRCSVVERRARFKLSHAQQRKHIIEGIVVGLDNVDEVIELITKASSHSSATAALQSEYGLSEKQAKAILEITLRRLTALERKKFTDESSSLTEHITKLEQLLSTRANILKLIEQEAIELKDRFSSPRRSMLEDSDSGDLEDIDVIPNEEMLMAICEKGYVKTMKADTFNLQHRGTIGKSVGKLRVDDAMSDFLVMHMTMSSSFDRGIVYSTRA